MFQKYQGISKRELKVRTNCLRSSRASSSRRISKRELKDVYYNTYVLYARTDFGISKRELKGEAMFRAHLA